MRPPARSPLDHSPPPTPRARTPLSIIRVPQASPAGEASAQALVLAAEVLHPSPPLTFIARQRLCALEGSSLSMQAARHRVGDDGEHYYPGAIFLQRAASCERCVHLLLSPKYFSLTNTRRRFKGVFSRSWIIVTGDRAAAALIRTI